MARSSMSSRAGARRSSIRAKASSATWRCAQGGELAIRNYSRGDVLAQPARRRRSRSGSGSAAEDTTARCRRRMTAAMTAAIRIAPARPTGRALDAGPGGRPAPRAPALIALCAPGAAADARRHLPAGRLAVLAVALRRRRRAQRGRTTRGWSSSRPISSTFKTTFLSLGRGDRWCASCSAIRSPTCCRSCRAAPPASA